MSKAKIPFRYFHSSRNIMRMVVIKYVRYGTVAPRRDKP
jgi:hypothetical protein